MVKVRDDLPQTQDGVIDVKKWLQAKGVQYTQKDIELLEKACAIALARGSTELTEVGESCYRQGLVIAEIIHELEPEPNMLASGIIYYLSLHGLMTDDEIQQEFNHEVLDIIQGLKSIVATQSKHKSDFDDANLTQHDNLRRMLLAIVQDVRVVLIKLAERISVLRASRNKDEFFKKKIALEVRDIYAPIANRLGIGQVKWELEDFAFRYLHPDTYKQIAKLLDEKRLDREKYIQDVIDKINQALESENIHAMVYGRVKHIYSIWRKMIRKNIDFKEVYDIRAVRILVDELRDCYAALGVVHSLWQHIPHEFDDYIATPKENGYRSLHTAVIGPEGKTLEIQIRTHDMHQEAELGVAAHWVYKEGGKLDTSYQQKLNNLRQILEESEDFEGDELQDDILKDELDEDRVYVFTPNGKVIDLPHNSTPIDFAYHIHSELGHRCRGAKVNGSMVQLNYRLHSGDQVEILATKEGGPSRDWLNPNLGYMASSRARAKATSWFRKQDRDKNIAQGRDLLEKELKRLAFIDIKYSEIATLLKFKNTEDLFHAIGVGETKLAHVIQVLSKQAAPQREELVIKKPKKQLKGPDVQIAGIGNLLSHFAKCCKPVPGDPIVGFITLGRGVTIHRNDCINILQMPEEEQRLIEVNWGEVTTNAYPVDIEIAAYDRQGLLRDITAILSNDKVNVLGINSMATRDDKDVVVQLTIEITDLVLLGKILSKIRQLPNVFEAHRVRND